MVKYSEVAFLSMFNSLKAVGPAPDVCVCGSDLIAQDILKTIKDHGLEMHVIVDNEISSKRYWLTTNENLSQMPCGGRN